MEFSLKTIIGISSLFLMTHSISKASEVFYAPDLCVPQELRLVLINNTKEAQKAWIQVRTGSEIDEIQQEIPPESKLAVTGEDFLKTHQAFSVKTPSNGKLQALVQCTQDGEFFLNSHTSPSVSYRFSEGSQSLKLQLLNLYLKSNKVSLKAFDAQGGIIAERALILEKSYDTQSLKWILSRPAVRLEINAEARLNSQVLYESQGLEVQSQNITSKTVAFNVDLKKTYFLVSTRQSPDAGFVIALEDPNKIATAREQIAHPELEKIVVAKVDLGSGNFNRAFFTNDRAPYSWSVAQVDGFADFAHIDCDGSPDLVEERLERKLLEGGRICFWRYRVVRELSVLEVASGLLLNKP